MLHNCIAFLFHITCGKLKYHIKKNAALKTKSDNPLKITYLMKTD